MQKEVSVIKSRAATALPRKKISTYLRLSEDIIQELNEFDLLF